jgi:SWI/SNF related-matrix-associated actin-dependent regulator of chromatin subfamily C
VKEQFKNQLANLNPAVIPICASWFNPNQIHELEKESLPEFFTGVKSSKTPETYKQMRNSFIDMYRENPRGYLTATICRRRYPADACTILRVHAFLEHWGLINFNYDLKKSEMLIRGGMTSYEGSFEEIDTKFDLLVRNREAIDPGCKEDDYFHTFASITRKIRPRCDACGYFCGDTWFRKDLPIFNTSGMELSDQKNAQTLDICPHCFEKKLYPEIFHEDSFEKISFSELLKDSNLYKSEFTKEEKFKLLDLIKSSQHEGTKWYSAENLKSSFPGRSEVEVIYNFLKIPLEDIPNLVPQQTQGKGAQKSSLQIDIDQKEAISTLISSQPHVINDFDNPLMKHIAVFKIFLDKIYNGKEGDLPNNREARTAERD